MRRCHNSFASGQPFVRSNKEEVANAVRVTQYSISEWSAHWIRHRNSCIDRWHYHISCPTLVARRYWVLFYTICTRRHALFYGNAASVIATISTTSIVHIFFTIGHFASAEMKRETLKTCIMKSSSISNASANSREKKNTLERAAESKRERERKSSTQNWS